MKHFLLPVFTFLFSYTLYSQKDTVTYSMIASQKEISGDAVNIKISIYPVPVRDNTFTIKSEKEISAIKITNIIGQEILRIKYSSPQFISKIILDNPKRGMYLVAVIFSDDTRIVKKIMVEGVN